MSDDPLYHARFQEISDNLEMKGQGLLGIQLTLNIFALHLIKSGAVDRDALLADLRYASEKAKAQETREGSLSYSVSALLETLEAQQ